MIKSLKAYLYNSKLKERLSKIRQGKKQSHNSFKNVIIYLDGTDGVERKVIQKYAQELSKQGSTIKLISFVNTKDQTVDIGIDHYTLRDINWYDVPYSSDLDIVFGKSYDVMISLLSEIDKHHTYVIKAIDADLKIGPHIENEEILFDISVDHMPQLGIPELIKNIKSSLKLLSQNE